MVCEITTTLNNKKQLKTDLADLSQVDMSIYDHVTQINVQEWASVVKSYNRFLCLDYLSALENAHDEGLEIRYAVFRLNGKVIGASAFQITHFTTSDDAYSNALLKTLNSIVRFFRGKHVHNILICGNAIATGEHGFSFPGIESKRKVSLLIARAMNAISRQEKAKGKAICAMVVKDFYPESADYAEELRSSRFQKFQVDHNMVMPILEEWNSFDDYLLALNTKFRTKAKSAMNKSSVLRISVATSDEVKSQLDKMQMLYDNVNSKADFRLGKLDLKAIPAMLDSLPGQFVVRNYYLENELVGFLTAMRCGDVLEAHVIGIDYEKNRDLGIYQRMLYDYVAIAIAEKCKRIVFGRTAEEIKSTVGAFPVDLTCCILHRRRISNALLSHILQYVKPSEYPQRQPYKAEVLDKLIAMGVTGHVVFENN